MWMWCPACQQCFREGLQRRDGQGLPRCPYPNCTGLDLSFWPWYKIRQFNSGFPPIPELNIRYPVLDGCRTHETPA